VLTEEGKQSMKASVDLSLFFTVGCRHANVISANPLNLSYILFFQKTGADIAIES
jgi:hypothetical protein